MVWPAWPATTPAVCGAPTATPSWARRCGRPRTAPDLINGDCITNPRGEPTLAAVASAVGVSQAQAIAWLDPTAGNALGDFTHAIWDSGIADANLAIIEVRNGAPFGHHGCRR